MPDVSVHTPCEPPLGTITVPPAEPWIVTGCAFVLLIVHNTRVIHGSHASRSATLRRTIYYEFRTLEWMASPEHAQFMRMPGRDLSAWIKARARLLQHAIDLRRSCAYAAGEAESALRIPEAWLEPQGEFELSPSFGGSYF